MSSRTLLFQSPPIQNESLVGYLTRIAELNRYPQMSWIGNLAKVDVKDDSLLKMSARLSRLAKVIGVSAREMQSLFYYASANGNHSHVVLPKGEIIPRRFLQGPNERVCFTCLHEKGFVSGLWDLKVVTHCPEHGEKLRTKCPSCKEPVLSNRGRLVPCLPGCAYRGSGRKCSDSVLGLMQIISNKFLGSDYDVSKHCFPRQLEDSDLYTLMQTISFLGIRSWREGSVVDRGCLYFMPDLMVEQMGHVAEALRDWPRGYFRFLDDICAGKDAPDGAIAMHWMFGGYYKCLVEAQKRLHFLFDGLQDYMNERLEGYFLAGRGSPAILKVRDRRRYIPGFIARKQLGVGRQEFARLVDRSFLQSRVFKTSYGDVVCVHRDSVREYAKVKQRLVGRRQLSEELGISLHSLYSLSIGNVLKPFHSPQKDGWPQWYYDRKAVDEWLSDLRALAQPTFSLKQTLRLPEAVAAYNKQGVSYCSLFHAVGEGTLRLYHRQKDNEKSEISLNCFHLSRFQLKKWYPSRP